MNERKLYKLLFALVSGNSTDSFTHKQLSFNYYRKNDSFDGEFVGAYPIRFQLSRRLVGVSLHLVNKYEYTFTATKANTPISAEVFGLSLNSYLLIEGVI